MSCMYECIIYSSGRLHDTLLYHSYSRAHTNSQHGTNKGQCLKWETALYAIPDHLSKYVALINMLLAHYSTMNPVEVYCLHRLRQGEQFWVLIIIDSMMLCYPSMLPLSLHVNHVVSWKGLFQLGDSMVFSAQRCFCDAPWLWYGWQVVYVASNSLLSMPFAVHLKFITKRFETSLLGY